MPGFLDKIKSGADKAAFEADRLMRLNQAQSALKTAQRELETELAALGQQVLALYDAGTLAQPELLDSMPKIETLRQRVTVQEAEVERVREDKPPEAGVAPQAKAAAPVAPVQPVAPVAPPTPMAQAGTCPNCGAALKPGVKFCPECGARVGEA